MNTDWQSLLVLLIGWAQGVGIGWMLWRRPQLTYKDEE